MMRCIRRLSAICLVICLIFSGCRTKREYSGISIGNADSIAGTIRTAMQHRAYRVRINFKARTLKRDQVKAICDDLISRAFYDSDDPQGGDYLRYQYGGYEVRHTAERKFFKYNYQVRITPVYYSTAGQEEEVTREIGCILRGFALADDASDYEKILHVRDYVANMTKYDTVHKHQAGSNHIQSTAYGALIYHTALCQGYAVATYRLLKELGIDNRIVTGMATVEGKSELHAWNIVRIGEKYYNLDVTMDDVKGNYDYFLKTDETFASDHVRDEEYASDVFYQSYPMAEDDYVPNDVNVIDIED